VISTYGRTALAVVDMRGNDSERQETSGKLQDIAREASGSVVEVYFIGTSALTRAVTERQTIDIVRSKAVGIPISVVILLLAFRTVVQRLGAAGHGLTAQVADLEDEVVSKAPLVVGIVLAASFLLLVFAFRSLILPLKAIAMNLLVVGSAGGLLVLAFQDGHLRGARCPRCLDDSGLPSGHGVRDPIRPLHGPRAVHCDSDA